jgi:hypothetical protein
MLTAKEWLAVSDKLQEAIYLLPPVGSVLSGSHVNEVRLRLTQADDAVAAFRDSAREAESSASLL